MKEIVVSYRINVKIVEIGPSKLKLSLIEIESCIQVTERVIILYFSSQKHKKHHKRRMAVEGDSPPQSKGRRHKKKHSKKHKKHSKKKRRRKVSNYYCMLSFCPPHIILLTHMHSHAAGLRQ